MTESMQPWLHALYPGWPLMAWIALAAVLPRDLRRWASVIAPLAAAAALFSLPSGTYWEVEVAGYFLMPFRIDAVARPFVLAFAVVAALANIFAWRERSRMQSLSAQVYAATAIAAVCAGDLLTFLVCEEIMVLASFMLIWSRPAESAQRAGWRFLLVHATGGALFFAGAFLYYNQTGSWLFSLLEPGTGWWLILASFLIHAAVIPLHAWLPDAYPESTATGAVYLCAFTTKTAVYALVRGYAGTEWLAWLGVATALYGVIFALMQDDIRRLLSYHLIGQIGYMVVGVGLGTSEAIDGSIAHAANHLLYKALLFMAAGAVMFRTGITRLSQLGRVARGMPWTYAFFLAGAFAIAGVPGFNGFVSKSILFEASAHHSAWMELLLLASASGTFLSIALKISYYAFLHGNAISTPASPAPRSMRLAMGLTALLCILLGIFPDWVYGLLPYGKHHSPYGFQHVWQNLQLLLWTAAGFVWVRRALRPHPGRILDTDWIYRDALGPPLQALADMLGRARHAAAAAARKGGRTILSSPLLGGFDRKTAADTALWLMLVLALAGSLAGWLAR